MKFRMLFVAALLAMMCSMAFGQGAVVILSELDASLTNNCDGSGGCIPQGALASIKVDVAPAGPGPEDPLVTVGAGPSDWNFNTFPINPDDVGACGGYFNFDTWATNAAAPNPTGPFYVQISAGTARWSSGTRTFGSGPGEWEADGWVCATTTQPCIPEGASFTGLAPQYDCINVCAGAASVLSVFGCAAGQPPHVQILPGCLPGQTHCDASCPPGQTNPMGPIPPGAWTYDGAAWRLTIAGVANGCVCVEWLGCEPPACTQDPIAILRGNRDNLGAAACIQVCPNGSTLLVVCSSDGSPLNPANTPIVSWTPGCLSNGCEVSCPPGTIAEPSPIPLPAWTYNAATGCFETTIHGVNAGCICARLDNFLAANILEFSAIAMDNSVRINFVTASETNVNYFDITRSLAGHGEYASVGRVSAEHSTGGTYSYVDESAQNGTSYTYVLVSVDMNGERTELGTTEATPSFNAAVITEYALHQNFPNPFNPTTQITFDLVNDNFVSLKVYNVKGQVVGTVVNGTMDAGRHTVNFDAGNLTSGLYFYTVKIGNEFTATKKMMLVK